jgi:hypothetical protein
MSRLRSKSTSSLNSSWMVLGKCRPENRWLLHSDLWVIYNLFTRSWAVQYCHLDKQSATYPTYSPARQWLVGNLGGLTSLMLPIPEASVCHTTAGKNLRTKVDMYRQICTIMCKHNSSYSWRYGGGE